MDGSTPQPPQLRWYESPFKLILVSGGFFVIVIAIVMAVLVGRFWWQIKHGGAERLREQFSASFSVLPGTSSLATPALAIDRSKLELASAPSSGSASAPVVVVEFIDFQCPNCRAAVPIMHQLLAKYGRQVHLIIRHFPVESTHPGATRLAQVSVCAQAQGQFWSVYDWFYKHQSELADGLTPDDLATLSASTNLDNLLLVNCLADPATLVTVNRDYADAIGWGVRGTPTFFINGERVEGVIPFAVWEGYLKKVK